MNNQKNDVLFTQAVPLILTGVIFLILAIILRFYIHTLNIFTDVDLSLNIRLGDVLVGMTIYLKTSVDFAIFIGNLMHAYPGWKNRIAIEIGTAVGNALGTIIVLTIWNFFRNVEILLALMIFIASLVLLRLAEDGFEHALSGNAFNDYFRRFVQFNEVILQRINKIYAPLFNKLIPSMNVQSKAAKASFLSLFVFAFTVPFILGLDDFAGYVPLFKIINVFGFAVGVFLGHMILNIFLFISPNITINVVRNAFISLIGAYVFIGLAIWGISEALHILL